MFNAREMVRSLQRKAISTFVVSPLVLASLNLFYAICHAIDITTKLLQGKPRKSPILTDSLIYNSIALRQSVSRLPDVTFFRVREFDTGHNCMTELVIMGFWAIYPEDSRPLPVYAMIALRIATYICTPNLLTWLVPRC